MSAKLLALIGPTASGKSELALKLAQEYGAHILSCDSLLVYRDLQIGTAKPDSQEMAQIPHYGIDLVNPDQDFTAGDYVRYARPLLDQLIAKGTPVLIVGGTGFYLKALLCGVWDAPPTQPELRARLEAEVAHLDEDARAQALYDRLAEKDPDYAAKIKANDIYRVIRALEIIEITGEPVSKMLSKRQLQNPLPYPFTVLGIKRSKVELERRILERTNQMFSKGLVNETKSLLQKYPVPPRSMNCVGYHEVLQLLEEKMTLPECRERVFISTRQLAKKQMTFFKTFPSPIQWFSLPKEEDELLAAASKVLSGRAS